MNSAQSGAIVIERIEYDLLLVQGEVNGHSHRNGSTHHRVVTHTEEAHHLYVSRH